MIAFIKGIEPCMYSRMAVSAVESLGHSFRRVPWAFFDEVLLFLDH